MRTRSRGIAKMHSTGVGRDSANKFWNRFWIRFSRISDIICIYGVTRSFYTGFYYMFTFYSIGMSWFKRGTPTRNL